MEDSREPDSEQNEHLAAFRRFKKYRDRINPVVDSSVDIDKLINESSGYEPIVICTPEELMED